MVQRRTNIDTVDFKCGNLKQIIGGRNILITRMQQKCDTRLSTFNATTSATKGNNVLVPFIDGKRINY